MAEMIIIVDENDNQIGIGEKMEVHRNGALHRCFSIFVLNSSNQMLLQKRAKAKYHSGGLWTNSCCSHPREGEDLEDAIHRRLVEEMGFDCPLKKAFSFIYKAELDNNLVEHEFDHVYVGVFDGAVEINTEEADDFAWVPVEQILKDVEENPMNYTVWFKIALEKLVESGIV